MRQRLEYFAAVARWHSRVKLPGSTGLSAELDRDSELTEQLLNLIDMSQCQLMLRCRFLVFTIACVRIAVSATTLMAMSTVSYSRASGAFGILAYLVSTRCSFFFIRWYSAFPSASPCCPFKNPKSFSQVKDLTCFYIS